MSRLSEIFREISTPVTKHDPKPKSDLTSDPMPQPDQTPNSRMYANFDMREFEKAIIYDEPDDNVPDFDVDRVSDNRVIELQLSESLISQRRKLDEYQNDLDQKLLAVHERYEDNRKNLSSLYDQVVNLQNKSLADNISDLMHKIDDAEDLEKQMLHELHNNVVAKTLDETKKLTQSIYHNSIVDSMLMKLENPSFDLEFGLALGILLHNDKSYCPDDHDLGLDSDVLMRRYFMKELSKSELHSQKLFEEHLISRARETLLRILSNRAIPFGSKKADRVIVPRSGSTGIRLTDTDIRHSFELQQLK